MKQVNPIIRWENPIKFFFISTFLMAVICAFADSPVPMELNGQIRTRTELDKKKATEDTDAPFYTGIRSRLGVTAHPSEIVLIKFEAQDSRFFGSEIPEAPGKPHTATVSRSRGTLDLHQGYFQVKRLGFTVTMGRQKIRLGSQRFVSDREWHPNAGVFDGIRYEYGSPERFKGTAFLTAVKDSAHNMVKDNLTLGGLHLMTGKWPATKMELYGFYEKSSKNMEDYLFWDVGARLYGSMGPLFYDGEIIGQFGRFGELDRRAWYASSRLGTGEPGGYRVSFGCDAMSGDPNDTGEGQYEAHYFFAHAYFGWLDYFVENPKTGVTDLRVDFELPIHKNILVKSQNHYFLQTHPNKGNDKPYGWEFDLAVKGAFFAKSDITVGAGLFLPDKGAMLLQGTGFSDKKPAYHLYIMPDFRF